MPLIVVVAVVVLFATVVVDVSVRGYALQDHVQLAFPYPISHYY